MRAPGGRGTAVAAWVLLAVSAASPVTACSPGYIPTPEELVAAADGIHRVRADGLAPMIVHDTSGWARLPDTRVRFTVLATLKGAPLDSLAVPGELAAEPDPNDHPPPYGFVRPGGRHGNCYALGYVGGQQYLLFLRDGDPYWAALAPTNEEVAGVVDPWVVWVQQRLHALPVSAPPPPEDPACARFDLTVVHCPVVTVAPVGLARDEFAMLQFTVRGDGSVADVQLMLHGRHRAPEPVPLQTHKWAEPVVAAVSQWRYRPSGREGTRQLPLPLFAAPGQDEE